MIAFVSAAVKVPKGERVSQPLKIAKPQFGSQTRFGVTQGRSGAPQRLGALGHGFQSGTALVRPPHMGDPEIGATAGMSSTDPGSGSNFWIAHVGRSSRSATV